jgi:hypothetical protein
LCFLPDGGVWKGGILPHSRAASAPLFRSFYAAAAVKRKRRRASADFLRFRALYLAANPAQIGGDSLNPCKLLIFRN